MKKLKPAQIEAYRLEIVNNWRNHKLANVPARVEFPLGELAENLAGFSWAWKMKGEMPETAPITKSDSFNAQGLEGKCVKRTDLATAVTIHANCSPHRCQVFV